MKKITHPHISENGFTLVEVIVTILIAAVFGSMLITFLGPNPSMSITSVVQTQNQSIARGAMESVTAGYANYTAGTITWGTFLSNCTSSGPYTPYIESTVIINHIDPISYTNPVAFQTLEVTVATGNPITGKQRIVSYFMQ